MTSYTKSNDRMRKGVIRLLGLLHLLSGAGLVILLKRTIDSLIVDPNSRTVTIYTNPTETAPTWTSQDYLDAESPSIDIVPYTPWESFTMWLDTPLTLPVILLVLWVLMSIAFAVLLLSQRRQRRPRSGHGSAVTGTTLTR